MKLVEFSVSDVTCPQKLDGFLREFLVEAKPQPTNHPMKRKRFSEEKIISILKEAEAGAKTPDLARKHGISEGTLYRWKSKYGGMEVSEAKRLKRLEEENGRLKRIVADQALDIQMLKDVNSKKW